MGTGMALDEEDNLPTMLEGDSSENNGGKQDGGSSCDRPGFAPGRPIGCPSGEAAGVLALCRYFT